LVEDGSTPHELIERVCGDFANVPKQRTGFATVSAPEHNPFTHNANSGFGGGNKAQAAVAESLPSRVDDAVDMSPSPLQTSVDAAGEFEKLKKLIETGKASSEQIQKFLQLSQTQSRS